MVTPAKVVQEMKGKEKTEDVLDIIRKHTMKTRPKVEHDLLKPTLANLFGLEVRFKEQDKRFKAEERCKTSMAVITKFFIF